MIVDKINEYLSKPERVVDEGMLKKVGVLAEWCFKKNFMENKESDSRGKIYPSSLGKCVRQIAYGYHGIEKDGKEIDGRGRITFWFGDQLELMALNLAQLSGCNIRCIGLDQVRTELKVLDKSFYGYADGLLYQDQETYLVECKSMSSYAFARFEKGFIDPTYLTQVNAYMWSLGIHLCVFLGVCKDNSVMHEQIIKYDADIMAKARLKIGMVLESTPEKLPDAPMDLEPDEKGYYPWNCLYCAWWKKCRTNAELVVKNNSYKLKEKKGVQNDN